jgi:hypothetical protein
VLLENFKETFDQLYREGEEGCPKWLGLTLHSHMAGRPTLSNTIRRCLDYVHKHGRVFHARSRDVAEWALRRETAGKGS